MWDLLYPYSWFVWSCKGFSSSGDCSCIIFIEKVSNWFTKEVVVLVHYLDLENKEEDPHGTKFLGNLGNSEHSESTFYLLTAKKLSSLEASFSKYLLELRCLNTGSVNPSPHEDLLKAWFQWFPIP